MPAQGTADEPSWRHWGLLVLYFMPMIVVLLLIILGVGGAK